MNESKKYCQVCGKELTGQKTKFCSIKCSRLDSNKRNREYYWRNRPRKKCPICGKEFDNTRRIYCSDECWKMGQKMRKATIKDEVSDKEFSNWLAEREDNHNQRKRVTRPFEDVVLEAEWLGISYGEWVARYDS